jgi:hypothetical protein
VSDKPSLAERLRSGEGAVSIINEPVVDFVVDLVVKEPASEIAKRRWFRHGEDHERE